MIPARTLIVGIGSPYGDDVAGWKVAEQLANTIARADVCVKQAASPIQLLHWIDDANRLVLCDACRGLGQTGEVRQWSWPAPELANVTWSGTHDFSLTASLQLADRLDRLPSHIVIWTVEAATNKMMDSISPEVAAAVPRMANKIAEVEACTNNHS